MMEKKITCLCTEVIMLCTRSQQLASLGLYLSPITTPRLHASTSSTSVQMRRKLLVALPSPWLPTSRSRLTTIATCFVSEDLLRKIEATRSRLSEANSAHSWQRRNLAPFGAKSWFSSHAAVWQRNLSQGSAPGLAWILGRGCFSSAAAGAEKKGAAGGTEAELAADGKGNPEFTTKEEEKASDGNKKTGKSSVDSGEVARFAAIADSWWDHSGPYKPLHVMNPTRMSFIRAALCTYLKYLLDPSKDSDCAKPLEGLRIVDVGCGGGLACEPLARLGGEVTGVDAVEKNIAVASLHAARDSATSSIVYRCTTAEQLVQEEERFDAVIALEVIEHVADPRDFCKSLAALAKKDGVVIISTINRSISSWGLAIVAAEYIFGWLPRGTHQWAKFITPEELVLLMQEAGFSVDELAGMVYNPVTRKWSLSEDTSVNYIICGRRQVPS